MTQDESLTLALKPVSAQVAPGRLPASLRVDAVIVDAREDQPNATDAAAVHGLLNTGGVLVLVATLPESQVGVTKRFRLTGWY